MYKYVYIYIYNIYIYIYIYIYICVCVCVCVYVCVVCMYRKYMYVNLSRRLVSCRSQSMDLQSKSIDWFLHGSGFCWGLFPNRPQYSFIFGSSHRKVSFNYKTCSGFILGAVADFSWQFQLRMSPFAGVFMFFVCIYFTGPSFADCFRSAYFLENLSTKEEFNFGNFFQILYVFYKT